MRVRYPVPPYCRASGSSGRVSGFCSGLQARREEQRARAERGTLDGRETEAAENLVVARAAGLAVSEAQEDWATGPGTAFVDGEAFGVVWLAVAEVVSRGEGRATPGDPRVVVCGARRGRGCLRRGCWSVREATTRATSGSRGIQSRGSLPRRLSPGGKLDRGSSSVLLRVGMEVSLVHVRGRPRGSEQCDQRARGVHWPSDTGRSS